MELAIKRAREKANVSREKLANKVGITQNTLYNYEIGKSIPRADTLKLLADELGVEVGYFFTPCD